MSVYKVVVTGPFNSGKTEFVKSASDIPVVLTEKNITTEDRGIKAETTVAMDFGRATVQNDTLHLFGTPGQTRFNFMWEILAKEMDAFIVLIDATDRPSFPDAAELIEQFSGFVDVPYILVANKVDLDDASSLDEVREGTKARPEIIVTECVALDRASVQQILLQIQKLIVSARA